MSYAGIYKYAPTDTGMHLRRTLYIPRWALLPTQMTSGNWVWLTGYWGERIQCMIFKQRRGRPTGLRLTRDEYLVAQLSGEMGDLNEHG